MPNRKKLVIGAAIALAVVGGAAVAAFPVRKAITDAQACDSIKASIARDGAIQRVSGEGITLAVLGDSYTSGDGLPDREGRWVEVLSADEDYTIVFDGIGMTGYTHGGYCGGDQFSTRIGALTAEGPDVMIIQGGVNDWEADPAAVEAEAARLLSTTAPIPAVLVGPADVPSRDGEDAVDAALRAAAEAAGARYISALDWPLPFLPDGLHLTADGHRLFAEHIAAELD